MSHSPNVGLIADLVSELSTCTQLSVNVGWNRGALAPWQISHVMIAFKLNFGYSILT